MLTGNTVGKEKGKVNEAIDNFNSLYDEKSGSVEKRKSGYVTMVNDFYDLVTQFYEYGWGLSFHFAPRHFHESFDSSILRHEYALALSLELKPGKKILDLGSGVGGPMMNIASFSGATIIGINNNEFQIQRANSFAKERNLSHLVSSVRGDFMNLPFADNSCDGAYQVEALCHAPDKKAVYREVFRVLKPGAMMAGYQWNTTAQYDGNNPQHRSILHGIESGNSLPETSSIEEELEAIRAAGFEIIEHRDAAIGSEIPWYEPLAGNFSLSGFKHTRLGRYLTDWMVWTFELTGIAPKGTMKVHKMLMSTAESLVQAGEKGIFTPMFFYHLRKPGRQ